MRDSSISAIASVTGGNILIDPHFMFVDQSTISALGLEGGQAGNLTIRSDYFFRNESRVFATSQLEIESIDANLANSLDALRGALVDASLHLQERCAMRLGIEASSFLVLGRGGVQEVPDEPQREVARRKRARVRER